MNNMLMIEVQYAAHAPNLPSKEELISWAEAARTAAAGATGEITLRVVSTAEIQQLNHDYRGKDSPTNVLSFPFFMPEGLPAELHGAILGDIALCANIIAAESQAQGKALAHHWAHMVVHGVLHLLGYDHTNDADASEMETLETKILATFGIADPYLPIDEPT